MGVTGMIEKTYKIPESRLAELRIKVEKINKVATKLKMPLVVMTADEYEMVEVKRTEQECDVGVPVQYKKVYTVILNGETPVIDGWAFRASLVHLYGDEVATIIKSVPGYDSDIPVVYRDRSGICDHCGYTRHRKKTYVLEHDDGRWIQVGSTCLKDFVGAYNPDAAARACEYLIELDDMFCEAENGEGGRGERYHNLEMFISTVAAEIRCCGFMSRTKAYEQGRCETADIVLSRMDGGVKVTVEEMVTDDDQRVATEAIAWVK